MSRLSESARRDQVVVAISLAGLFVLALGIRLFAAAQLPFPATEAAAYYSGVAQHLVRGEGLVSDAVWSFATPPLVAPKPAFELWMPLSSFVSALAMSLLGATYSAAQVGGALLGALVAPMGWAVGRSAARAGGLERRRVGAVSLATGILAALLAPFVLSSAIPDSFTPFAVAMLAAALLVPAAVGLPARPGDHAPRPAVWAGLGLGLCLGLGYLSRQEAIWLGLVVLVMVVAQARTQTPGSRVSALAQRLWPVVVGGLLVVVPWLIRNAVELGSPFPGQTVENLFLLRNEDIFAFTDRPDASAYLGQATGTLLGNPIAAAEAAFTEVLLLPAFPVGIVGLLSILGLWRSSSLRHPTALQALLISGALTFLATVILFPVASRWGTYLHASGPFLVGLTASAALGADALVARISRWRGWSRSNVVIGPAALVAVAVVMGVLQLDLLADQTRGNERRYEAVARSLAEVRAGAGASAPETLMTDHPMWLATVTGDPAIALPDEDPTSLQALGQQFGTNWLVVMDERGRYPAALLDGTGSSCLSDEPRALGDREQPAWLFRLAETCTR